MFLRNELAREVTFLADNLGRGGASFATRHSRPERGRISVEVTEIQLEHTEIYTVSGQKLF